jgi:hypothetical protein
MHNNVDLSLITEPNNTYKMTKKILVSSAFFLSSKIMIKVDNGCLFYALITRLIMIWTMRGIGTMPLTSMQQQRLLPCASGISAGVSNGTMKALRLGSTHYSAHRAVPKSNRACVITCSLNNTTSAPSKFLT